MNKKQEIDYKMKLFKQGYSTKTLDILAKFEQQAKLMEDMQIPAEGAKVKLNYERITTYPDYIKDKGRSISNHRQQYMDFVENNKDRIFTIKYDIELMSRHPYLLCLAEDERKSKWAWHPLDLIVVEDE